MSRDSGSARSRSGHIRKAREDSSGLGSQHKVVTGAKIMADGRSDERRRQKTGTSMTSGKNTSATREQVFDVVNTQHEIRGISAEEHLMSDLSHTRTGTREDDERIWREQQQQLGYVPTYKDDKRKVQYFIRNTLYHNMKFIMSESDLFARGRNTISNYVMNKLNIPQSYRQEFWEKQARNAYHALNQKRANASSDMMKVYTGELLNVEGRKTVFITYVLVFL